MSKKLDKLREAVVEALNGIEDENILKAIGTLAEGYASGSTEAAPEEDEGGKKDKKKGKKDKGGDAEEGSSDKIDFSALKKKQLKALVKELELEVDQDDTDAMVDALENVKAKKVHKAAEATGVSLGGSED